MNESLVQARAPQRHCSVATLPLLWLPPGQLGVGDGSRGRWGKREAEAAVSVLRSAAVVTAVPFEAGTDGWAGFDAPTWANAAATVLPGLTTAWLWRKPDLPGVQP